MPPNANEAGWKAVVIMPPREVTRIAVRYAPADTPIGASGAFPFDPDALEHGFLWHCHILDHEDNGMMRPYRCAQKRVRCDPTFTEPTIEHPAHARPDQRPAPAAIAACFATGEEETTKQKQKGKAIPKQREPPFRWVSAQAGEIRCRGYRGASAAQPAFPAGVTARAPLLRTPSRNPPAPRTETAGPHG
jgi:hypothetical protein